MYCLLMFVSVIKCCDTVYFCCCKMLLCLHNKFVKRVLIIKDATFEFFRQSIMEWVLTGY